MPTSSLLDVIPLLPGGQRLVSVIGGVVFTQDFALRHRYDERIVFLRRRNGGAYLPLCEPMVMQRVRIVSYGGYVWTWQRSPKDWSRVSIVEKTKTVRKERDRAVTRRRIMASMTGRRPEKMIRVIDSMYPDGQPPIRVLSSE